jgi:hypothetical protein
MTAVATISVIDAVLGCMAALSPARELEGSLNRGYFPDAINTWAGSPLGSAWCLNTCNYAGANAIGKARWPLPINGNCDVLLKYARKFGILRDTPARGAIFLKLNPENPEDATHAGYVDAVLPAARFATREGNSNEDGSSNGTDIVEIERPRKPGERYVFVYWWLLLR